MSKDFELHRLAVHTSASSRSFSLGVLARPPLKRWSWRRSGSTNSLPSHEQSTPRRALLSLQAKLFTKQEGRQFCGNRRGGLQEGRQFQAERAWRTIHAQSRTDIIKIGDSTNDIYENTIANTWKYPLLDKLSRSINSNGMLVCYKRVLRTWCK